MKLVTPNITAQLKKRKFLFSDFMTTEWKMFKDKDGKEFKRAVTFCYDLEGFIEYISILEDENWQDKCNVIGLDEGKGSIKIILTMYDKNNYEENAKKRVKRAKVLCKVRDVPESYDNMSILFNLINLNTILAKYSEDNKLLNIIAGLLSNSAKYSCAFGECFKVYFASF